MKMIKGIRLISTLLIAYCCVCSFALASNEKKDITLTDGRILKNAKILNSSPSDAAVMHDGGVENIKWEFFPKAIQEENGFKKQEAESYREESKEKSEMLAEQSRARRLVYQQLNNLKQEKIEAHVEVIQVVEGGILAKGYGFKNPRKENVTSYSSRKKGSGLYPNENVTTAHTRTVTKRDRVVFSDFIFIEIDIFDLGRFVDGSRVKLNIYPSGTFSYTAVTGGGKTIRKYTHGLFGFINESNYGKANFPDDGKFWNEILEDSRYVVDGHEY